MGWCSVWGTVGLWQRHKRGKSKAIPRGVPTQLRHRKADLWQKIGSHLG